VHARLQVPPAPESGAGAAGEGAAGPAGFAEYEDGEDPWDSDGRGASCERASPTSRPDIYWSPL
jgi:hypothetical protein